MYTAAGLAESTILPVVLFILVYKLKPNKPALSARWALITGSVYLFVFWLLNSSIWMLTYVRAGSGYLTSNLQNLFSFILTLFGLLALAIYTAYFAKKSGGTTSFRALKLKTIGGIIVALGLYFLWNYLSWIFFGSPYSEWYAWFLGHNLDLWMLSLPLLGVPLLFAKKAPDTKSLPWQSLG